MNVSHGYEETSHSLFAKTTGWANRPLKEDWGDNYGNNQGISNYGQLRNTLVFGTKLTFIPGVYSPCADDRDDRRIF